MNDFKEFVLINMALDLILIVAMCYLLGKHMPRFFAFLVIANLAPYFVALPLEAIPGLESKGRGTPEYFELLDIARHPENIIGKNNVPPPHGRIPALFTAFQPLSPWVQKDVPDPQASAPSPDSFLIRWQKALRQDPYALWILIRIFWIAGAVVVFFQRPVLGAGLAGSQLLPIPFLAYVVPYGALYLVSHPSFATLGQSLNHPSEIWTHLAPRFYSTLLTASVLLLVIGAVTLMVVAGRRLAPKRVLIQTYLDPKKYEVKLNGNLLPFEVKGNKLIIGDIPFDCSNIAAVDPKRPNVWLLGTKTLLEFVDKEPGSSGSD